MTEAAVTTPSTPSGANGLRLPPSNTVTPTTRKNARTASLMNTMIVLKRVLSRMPMQSTAVIASTMKTAGRLNDPPSPGGAASESGSVKPNSESARLLKYWPQPTATAATDTAYSRIRSQPMIHAAISPSVAYEYVYALPETGIEDASSANASAENAQVMPARTNERMIAGPESPIASPMTTKMPVPMIAPRPSAVRSSRPTTRASDAPFSSVSRTSVSVSLVAKRPLRPSLPEAVATGPPLRRGRDHDDGAAGALDQLDRHAAEDPAGHAAPGGGGDDDRVRLLLLREEQDAARHLAGADFALGLDAGLAQPREEAVDRVLRGVVELGARGGGQGFHVKAVERDDRDGGAGLLRELGARVAQPRLVGSRLGVDHDALHGAGVSVVTERQTLAKALHVSDARA